MTRVNALPEDEPTCQVHVTMMLSDRADQSTHYRSLIILGPLSLKISNIRFNCHYFSILYRFIIFSFFFFTMDGNFILLSLCLSVYSKIVYFHYFNQIIYVFFLFTYYSLLCGKCGDKINNAPQFRFIIISVVCFQLLRHNK